MEEGFYGILSKKCILSEMHVIDSFVTVIAASEFNVHITLKFRLSRPSKTRSSSHITTRLSRRYGQSNVQLQCMAKIFQDSR